MTRATISLDVEIGELVQLTPGVPWEMTSGGPIEVYVVTDYGITHPMVAYGPSGTRLSITVEERPDGDGEERTPEATVPGRSGRVQSPEGRSQR